MRAAALFLLFAAACSQKPEELPAARAAVETEPVGSADDAADDPAIWFNADDPASSLVLGTDKDAGLYLYDLKGAVVQFLPAGELNNVDLRQGATLGGWSGDIAAASNRTDNSVTLLTLENRAATVSGAFASPIVEPYGLCMGLAGADALVFVTYKTGDLIAFRLTGPDAGEEIGRLKLASQLEGCVFDDERRTLYIGEEDKGVWKADFADGKLTNPRLVDEVKKESGLKDDVEGLALYKTGADEGYLIVSSQGNYSYAVYERQGDNRFLGRFRIAAGETIDGAEETDGLEATSLALGPDFPKGVLVVQDGFNDPKGSAQNFKIVDWREVEKALALID